MRSKSLVSILGVLALTLFGVTNAQAQSPLAKVGGKTYASAYANWKVTIQSAPSASGAGTIVVTPGIPTNPDGSQIFQAFVNPGGAIFTPLIVGQGSANQETVTPTAISGCNSSGAGTATCSITATFANTHGPGDLVVSGDAGIQEAVNALGASGGIVVVDGAGGATDAILNAVVANPKVAIEDTRNYAEQWWTVTPGATVLAAPIAYVAASTVVAATSPAGSYANSAYVVCAAYVDILGQEGPCSPTASITPAAGSSSLTFTAPAASTGAVGYTLYVSLAGGTYTLAYKVPLVTQPTAVGAYPVSNGVCTLTTAETTTPACALTNATYGTTGSSAVVTAITLNTSPIIPQETVASTTSVYVPNPGGRTTYSYAPGLHAGTPGLPSEMFAYTITTAVATTVPNVLGTVNMPPGFMNHLGRTIEVCGEATTTASTALVTDIQFQWDAVGQNTAGKGVVIGDLVASSSALATGGHISFCEDFQTTVTGASATAGSINAVGGFETVAGLTGVTGTGAGGNSTTGAVASLNLADDARINVIYLHTNGTDGAGWILQSLTAKVVN